jgi:hypothetical protein
VGIIDRLLSLVLNRHIPELLGLIRFLRQSWQD